MGERSARAHIEVLAAEPRPAGGAAERAAREYCAQQLAAAGFSVREEEFAYSALPGYYGMPLSGLGSALLLIGAAYVALVVGGWSALALLAGGAFALGAVRARVTRYGVLTLPWMRRTAVNLVAERGRPTLWLVAHLDSKSQPVPIGLRAAGVIGSLATLLVAIAAGALAAAGVPVRGAWPWIAGVGVLAALPVVASTVSHNSPGALDNATGVAAVLEVAGMLPAAWPLGVILTSAEELGLAGARAWAMGRLPGRAINLDGLDDSGAMRLVHTGRVPRELAAAVLAAAREAGAAARVSRLPPGVLVDGVALADAGWDVLTVSRGTLRTVARIHTRRDSSADLTGSGCAEVAAVVARAVERLR